MSSLEEQNKVAGALVDLVAAAVGSGRAVHPETAIASAARLSGSLLLRSFNFNDQGLEPGSVLLSERANEEGPQLINILSAGLKSFGVNLDTEKLGGSQELRGEAPKLTVVQSLELLQDDALRIASKSGLEPKEAAQCAAMATAFIVKECAQSIGGEVGFNVAMYGFIEGSKTVPPMLRENGLGGGGYDSTFGIDRSKLAPKTKSRPWWRFWG